MSVILGRGGAIEFSREWPEPTSLPQSAAKQASVLCREPGFWTGQQVLVYSHLGVPLKLGDSLYAPSPDGHRFWGDLGVAGPRTLHRSTDSKRFWNTNDLRPFWEDASSTGFVQLTSAYIHRNQLDQITFYISENAAITKNAGGLIPFSPIQYRNLLIAPFDASSDYQIAIEALGSALFGENPSTEVSANTVFEMPQEIKDAYLSPDRRGWAFVAEFKDWALQTDPSVLDSTAIGEDFGDSVKDVVRGSGSFNCYIPVGANGLKQIDAKGFIRLMLMTETGSKARARFRIQEESLGTCEPEETVWIECDILLGPGEISASFDTTVNYSAQFVVVKDKDGTGIRPMIGIFS
jgi:hypothetical protein